MKIIEMCPREKGFVVKGHCQNLLDDPRISYQDRSMLNFVLHDFNLTANCEFQLGSRFRDCYQIKLGPMSLKLIKFKNESLLEQ